MEPRESNIEVRVGTLPYEFINCGSESTGKVPLGIDPEILGHNELNSESIQVVNAVLVGGVSVGLRVVLGCSANQFGQVEGRVADVIVC